MPINLKVLLPFRVFAEERKVRRIVARTPGGSFGIWPNRLDCAASLAPGILTYETEAGEQVDLAVDQGVIVKAGKDVLVSVRDAIGGMTLDRLHEAVRHQFLDLDRQELAVRTVLDQIEIGFIHRFVEFQHE